MRRLTECLFCGSPDHELLFQDADRRFPVDGLYDMSRCRSCGLLFLNPQPSPEDISPHYPPTYDSLQGERLSDARQERRYTILYGEKSNSLKKVLFSPFRLLLRTLPKRQGGRILDVGCGSGHFLVIARTLSGMDAYGVEPYHYDAEYAARHRLSIFKGSLEEAQFPGDFFDVVTLNHVLEHIGDPRSTLREVRRIVKPDGAIVVGIPQTRSLLYRLFGRRWWQLDVPRHLFVPSIHNLSTLAEELGFRISRVRYNGTPASILASLRYWRSDILGRHRRFDEFRANRVAFIALVPIAALINFFKFGDQVELVLTPR